MCKNWEFVPIRTDPCCCSCSTRRRRLSRRLRGCPLSGLGDAVPGGTGRHLRHRADGDGRSDGTGPVPGGGYQGHAGELASDLGLSVEVDGRRVVISYSLDQAGEFDDLGVVAAVAVGLSQARRPFGWQSDHPHARSRITGASGSAWPRRHSNVAPAIDGWSLVAVRRARPRSGCRGKKLFCWQAPHSRDVKSVSSRRLAGRAILVS